jgi:hypothetical protein
MALRITARRRIGASEGASGCAALRRTAPPHGPSALLASGPRRLPAARYTQLRQNLIVANSTMLALKNDALLPHK